jgi:uncharacterized protein (DUF2126 family)/transglutaminase-like putative cysteine protease
MSIRVALNHKTSYHYPRPILLGPQTIRLRPAAHSRTPVLSYSLRIFPSKHFVNWQQDAAGNHLARVVFPEKVSHFQVEVDLLAELTVINPFDFFLEPDATQIPFRYDAAMADELAGCLARQEAGPLLQEFLASIDRTPRRTIDFLVDLNRRMHREVEYVIRLEPGVQTCEETLQRRRGSCRDSALLLTQVLRHLGLAARFASGYLIQLKPDVKPLEGPAGADQDFADLHAWTEVYLPGAGWIGLDPTSGLLTGEGHIPLACTPSPGTAAPIDGSHEACESQFDYSMSISRIHEDARVTKPYTEAQWSRIESLGRAVDSRLIDDDVRLTMGGEPTFVSIDDMQGDEWRTEAFGPTKRRLADGLLWRLLDRFGHGGVLHYGQGKSYPGESLPRWAMRCYWRRDGQPLWRNRGLLARDQVDYGHTAADALRFVTGLAERLAVDSRHAVAAHEDVLYYLWKERRLPVNVDLLDNKLEDEVERARLSRVFEQGVTAVVGYALPLQYQWWRDIPCWQSGLWQVRSVALFLIPGDSPMGLRLPLQSLDWMPTVAYPTDLFPAEPFADHPALPNAETIHKQLSGRRQVRWSTPVAHAPRYAHAGGGAGSIGPTDHDSNVTGPITADEPSTAQAGQEDGLNPIVRTALCVEPRQGCLHVFIPPLDRLEAYVELIAVIEDTAQHLDLPVVMEGYLPPHDDRLQHISITPDPGVIEVNVHPAHSWDELVRTTQGVYEDARQSRLGTEKFDLDGNHTGTGGGNHIVLGGPRPADSPFLRRPHLLRSLLGFWHNHPSLSYLFSGRFIGPTSQAPRVDEGRRDAQYELEIAFEQTPCHGTSPPWLVDRIYRHLLVDGTGNTHRAEFCIDKLFSPDTSTGRLGLVEFRGFEMPPHCQMSLTQQLLLRALVARFWTQPYRDPLVTWNTSLHDRFMLPLFLWQDFEDVVEDLQQHGYAFETQWFAPHFEFRFPRIGQFTQRGVHVELRQACEPWYVLGEEPGFGCVSRYVDSSVERLQVLVDASTDPRYVLTCNGRRIPLHPTGIEGQFVAGVRYRAWQPPSCLHPTIPVDEPLVFDLLDTWMGRSMGGCRYHVGHPGGLNPEVFPVNAYEAESRRACRFLPFGHTPGRMNLPLPESNPAYPLTLDLRRARNRSAD